uniref:uncharacterized protein isoform X2 n=1 Tax=Myxine glutinosa TaxID=7769 RepID=UPI00358DDF46
MKRRSQTRLETDMSKRKSNIPVAGEQLGQATTAPASATETTGTKKKQASQVATAHRLTAAHPVDASTGQQPTHPAKLMEREAKRVDTTSQKKSSSKGSEDTHVKPSGKTNKQASPRAKKTPKIAGDEEKATGNTRAVASERPSSNSVTCTEPETAKVVSKPAKAAGSSGIDNSDLMGISTKAKPTPVVLPETNKDPIGLDFDKDPGANIDWSAGKEKVVEGKVKKEDFVPLVKGDEPVDGKKKGKPAEKDASEKGGKNVVEKVAQEPTVAAKSTVPDNKCAPTSKSAVGSSGIDNSDLIGISTKQKPTPVVLPEKTKDPIGLDFDKDPGADIDWSVNKQKVKEGKVKKEHFIPLVKGDEPVDGKKKGKPAEKDASEKGGKNVVEKVAQEPMVAAKSTVPDNKCAPTSKSAVGSSGIDNSDLIGISTKQKPTPVVLPEKSKDPIGLDFDKDPGVDIDWSVNKQKVKEGKVKKEHFIPLVKGDEPVDGKKKGKPAEKDASEKGGKNVVEKVAQEPTVAAKSTVPDNKCAPTSKSAVGSSGIDNSDLIGISTKQKPTPVVLPEKSKDPIGLDFDKDPGANIDWSAGKEKVVEGKVKKEDFVPLVKGDEPVDGKKKGKPAEKDASEKGGKNVVEKVAQEPTVAAKSTVPDNKCAPTSKSAVGSSEIDNSDLIGISTKQKPTPVVLPEKSKDPIGLDFDKDPGANIDWSAGKEKVVEGKVKKEDFVPLVKGDDPVDGKKKGKPAEKDASEKGGKNVVEKVAQEPTVAAKSTVPDNKCAPTSKSAVGSSGIDNSDLIGISTKQKPTPVVLPEKSKDPIGLDFDKDPGVDIDWSVNKQKVKEGKVKKADFVPLVKGDDPVDGKKKGKPAGKDASEKGGKNVVEKDAQEPTVAAKSTVPDNKCAPTSKSAVGSSGIDNSDLMGILTKPKPTPVVLPEKNKDPIGLDFDKDPGADIDWSVNKQKVKEGKVKKEYFTPLVEGDESVDGKKKGKPAEKDASEKGHKNAVEKVVQEPVVAAKSTVADNKCAPKSKSAVGSSGIDNSDLMGTSTKPKPTPVVLLEKNKDPIGLDFDKDPGADIDWSVNKRKVEEDKVKKEHFTPLVKDDESIDGKKKGKPAEKDASEKGRKNAVEKVVQEPVVAAKSTVPDNKCAPTSKSAVGSSGIDNSDLMGTSTKPKPTPVVLLEKNKDPIGLDFDKDPGADIDWSVNKRKVEEDKVKKEHFTPLVKDDESIDGKKKGKPAEKDASEKGRKNAVEKVVQEPVVAAKSTVPDNKCAPTSKSAVGSSGIDNSDLMGVSTKPKPPPVVLLEKNKDPIGLDFDKDPGADIDWSVNKQKVKEGKVKQEHFTPLIKGDTAASSEGKGTTLSQKDVKGVAANTVEDVLVAPKTASCVKMSAPCEKATPKEISVSHKYSENLVLSPESKVEGNTSLFKNTTVVEEQSKTAAASSLQAAVAGPGNNTSGILDSELIGIDMKGGKSTQAPVSKKNDENIDDIGLDFDDPNENAPDWSEGRALVKEDTIDKEEAFLLGHDR